MKKITLQTTFFDNNQIKALLLQNNGDMALILYLKLLFGASKEQSDGRLMFLDDVAYDEKIIAGICNIHEKTVKECLNLLIKFKLILKTNEHYVIADYEKIIGKHIGKKQKKSQLNNVNKEKPKQADDAQIVMGEDIASEG